MLRERVGALLIAAFCCAPLFPQGGALTRSQSTFDERLGPDDGAAAAILFGANLRGNLDMCDCAQPRGGLARRVGYVKGFKKKFPETTVIELEAGQFLYDSTGYPDYAMLQNEQVARAMGRWPVDVINLGRYDLIWARKMLTREGLAERMAALPMLKNLISANGVFDTDVVAPAPFIVKELTGPRIKGKRKTLKLGFVGLTEPIKPSAEAYDATVKNIFEVGRRTVMAVRKKCDVLVVVAHAEFDSALRLASENPEADVIIVGNAEAVFNERRLGKTLIICAAPGNTQEGDLRIYAGSNGTLSFKFRSTNLDSVVPADPEAAAYTDAARVELNRIRIR